MGFVLLRVSCSQWLCLKLSSQILEKDQTLNRACIIKPRDLRIGHLRSNRIPNRIGRYDSNSNRISNRICHKASSTLATNDYSRRFRRLVYRRFRRLNGDYSRWKRRVYSVYSRQSPSVDEA